MPRKRSTKTVETLTHGEASRKNIPTAEFRSVMDRSDQSPVRVAYERRNRDLDPQLVWRGKDIQDWSDLVVQAAPLFIQEKVHPKVLIDDLRRQAKAGRGAQDGAGAEIQPDLFADFNGLPSDDARTEFYQHDANWSNRMILGDSLHVMASVAEREGLRGKVQCIYLDPPYGIKFNSNFQWSTTSRDVKDGKAEHISREPEQVKAFRDTWRDGIHSYLTYLRDRLTVARDLLAESGSIFVQIGDENVHRVRARYPYYLLADSPAGQRKEAEIARKAPSETPTHGNVRQGFVYQRVPHVTLKSIVNNAEIDVIWERWRETLEPLRGDLNARLDRDWEEWQVPREASKEWPAEAVETHRLWWEARIARQQEVDASIAARAEHEFLYDKPYEDNRKVRVAGPFTVESLSPHRVLAVDENDELLDRVAEPRADYGPEQDFAGMILEQLATAGVQQAHKEDRITFAAVTPWPGAYICAEGRYRKGDGDSGPEKRAGVFVGPEFGTVSRPDLVAAAREAGDAGFDVLITCAFNYEAHASEFNRLGRIPVLKARMNADLHMADELKNTGKGNLFVIFGEPDIDILPVGGKEVGSTRIAVKINGVDVFHPTTGEVRSDGADGIACWFIDTDYNEESFFVRHAYFLGANDPYKALKTTLKAEIDADAWASLHSDISRPFDRPESGRIAVKVINHLGDEVMKVFRV